MILDNVSIKYKLIIIILFVTIFALGIGFSVIIANEIKAFKQDLVKNISTSAILTGRYCITAIAFEDSSGAEESLQILKTIPSISAGIIYNRYGKLFALMKIDTALYNIPKKNKMTDHTEFRDNFLHIIRPITYHNQDYGTIYVIASTKLLDSKIQNYMMTMALLTVFIIVISIVITFRIQKVISQPILKLAETTTRISESADYSIKVEKKGNDEISVLYDGFNNMLEQIYLKQQERDKAEKALRENEAALQSIFKTAPVGIGMVIDRILIRVNETLCKMTGYTENELNNKSIKMLYYNKEEYNKIGADGYEAIKRKGISINETLWKHKNGKKIDIQLNASPISPSDKSKGITFTSMDISGRKKIEEEGKMRLERIQKQKEALASITSRQVFQDTNFEQFYKNITNICTYALDAERVNIWFFDNKKVKIICVNSNSKTKKHHKKETSLVIKDYPEYFKAIRTGEPLAANNARTDPRTKEFTKNYLTPNNIYAMLDVIIKTSGREIGLICVEKNIIYQWENDEKTFIHSVSDQIAQFILSSEQKETLKELNKAQNYINNIINSMPSILIGVDVEGKVTHWNSLAEKTTGISEKNAKGALIEKLLPDYHSMLSRIKQAIEQKSTQKEEKIPISKNDVTNYSDITIYPLIANGVEGVVIRIDDVTESVNIEEMMIQSEKMLSVGGLAAGMAHEINNPLAGMLQNIQVIENRLQKNIPRNISTAEKYDLSFKNMQSYMEERDIWSMIDSVKQSGKRAAKIVDNMLSFSRKSESRYEEQDICQLLDVTVDLASNDYDLKKKYDFRQIKIIRQYEPNLPKVKCESSKIQQVFLNLLKNGAHAIAAQSWQQPEAKKKESCFILKIYVKDKMMNIEIGDNGPGMDESVRKRVFEPFFTTKQVGTGTGLGLSVSYFIITKNHNGTMSVESTPGEGTNFIIKLLI